MPEWVRLFTEMPMYFRNTAYIALWMVSFCAFIVSGQPTQIDLRSQARSVDFSAAAEVTPFPMGANLPAICKTGNVFWKLNAPAGQNIYLCISTNIWALLAPGGSVPDGTVTNIN